VPASLIPGHLGGSTTVASMGNLPRLAGSALRSSAPATVTVLSGARGSILAVGAGRHTLPIPLIVKSRLGDGAITYLAFDPGFDPIRRWAAAPVMLWRTLRITAPAAMSRASRPSGFPPPPPSAPGFGGPFDIGAELANIPAAALPSFILFIALVALYIVLVGPINFLLLSRLRRRELAWVTVPSAALVCLCCTALVAFHLKGNAVLLNVAGVIQLDGGDEPHPATFYVGLFAPLKGDFHLTADMPALPASVPEFAGFGPTVGASQPGMRLQEGAQTEVHFLSMNMWSMRSVALYTSVRIGGHIGSRLHLDTAGNIVGTVFNGTRLRLIRPVITAGSAVVHLPDLPAGGSIAVRIRPSADVHVQAYQPVGYMLYGQSASSGAPPTYYWRGPVFPRLGYAPVSSFCCSSPPAENSLTDRVRNLASALPEAATIPFLGEVILAGWSEQALIPMTVEGTSPQRRDLNLVLTPLSVSFPSGSFILRPGVLGARLVDDQPSGPLTSCCAPGLQPIYIGAHGAATFEFDLPLSRKSRGKVTIRRLNLSVDAGGANGHDIGSVYDWRSGRWLPIDLASGQAALPDPDRFASHDGSLLVRIRRTVTSGDIAIQNPYQNLQLSGAVITR